ncbi:hypothetical protein RRG08_038019 [Elysia crispata]|uniref:Uncharacterized protein n=1 Tax=Elysia crispata TaxID=231223 RepID=A0AAE0ZYS4_9GAST|nr:hypothetical protein RRG08_038019 [Elysia crispata]
MLTEQNVITGEHLPRFWLVRCSQQPIKTLQITFYKFWNKPAEREALGVSSTVVALGLINVHPTRILSFKVDQSIRQESWQVEWGNNFQK